MGTRVNPATIGYVWTGKFLYPERKSCGFKYIRIRVDGALVTEPPFWPHDIDMMTLYDSCQHFITTVVNISSNHRSQDNNGYFFCIVLYAATAQEFKSCRGYII